MAPRRKKQLELFSLTARQVRRADGSVVRLGRPVNPKRVGFMSHLRRPAHDWRHPVHVTMRRVRLAPSFRTERVRGAILEQLVAVKARGVRVLHLSIQHDHLHLMVEGQNAQDLGRQMQKLFSRIALAVNIVVGRRGSLFCDRHHRHELETPRETRNALVYILFNTRKHDGDPARPGAPPRAVYSRDALDRFGSAAWFDDWAAGAGPPPDLVARGRGGGAAPTVAPRTWLAQTGWRRAGGALRLDESPRAYAGC